MARRIAVEIVGDSRSLERAFKRSAAGAGKFDRQISKTGGRQKAFTGLTKGAGLLTGALGVGGLSTAVRASFEEMADGQKVAAQTGAVLKSTKGAANVTAGDVDKLSTALMNKSGVDDEAIASGENLLLTFKNIKNGVGDSNQIFDTATGTMLDMSTALGQDTKTSAIQLGKALNDPVKGVTSLRRVGVQFTDGQQKQIDAMVKSGDTMGAQKIILKELSDEFGGSAEAAGKTLPGQLNKLKQSASNLGGEVATTLTPMISDAAEKMTKWLQDGDNQKDVLDTIKGAAKLLGDGIGFLRGGFRLLSGAVGGNRNAVKLLIGMYAGFKVLTFAGRIATLAGSFRGLRGSTRRATGASANFVGQSKRTGGAAKTLGGRARSLGRSFAGKAGIAGGVALAAIGLSDLIRQIPGWDAAMKNFGGTVYDLASKLGLVNDETAKFEGKPPPGSNELRLIRRQARGLQAGGFNSREIVNRLVRQHPNVSRTEIEGAAGTRGSQVNINNLVVNSHNFRQLEDDIHRRAKRRPHPRRGS